MEVEDIPISTLKTTLLSKESVSFWYDAQEMRIVALWPCIFYTGSLPVCLFVFQSFFPLSS